MNLPPAYALPILRREIVLNGVYFLTVLVTGVTTVRMASLFNHLREIVENLGFRTFSRSSKSESNTSIGPSRKDLHYVPGGRLLLDFSGEP
jgi:hypothetical protein